MEYKLLKTIERPLALMMPNETLPRLTPFPATDYVNPGIGQISRLFSFYVPLHVQKNLHAIEKKVEIADVEKKIDNDDNLEGSGNSSDLNEIETQLTEDPMEFNEKRRKKMGSPVHNSFLHPQMRVKTNHVYFNNVHKKNTEIKNNVKSASKNIKHKFQFS
jgi:hypothetical protein